MSPQLGERGFLMLGILRTSEKWSIKLGEPQSTQGQVCGQLPGHERQKGVRESACSTLVLKTQLHEMLDFGQVISPP